MTPAYAVTEVDTARWNVIQAAGDWWRDIASLPANTTVSPDVAEALDAALDAYHAARLARDAADLADGLAEAGPALLRPWSVTLTNEPRPGQFRISGGAA